MNLASTSPISCGEGRVKVARVGGRSVAVSLRASSPLRLLTTSGAPAPWIFTTTFGGGLVDGDRVALAAELAEGTSAVLTTQASTKVYRSPRGTESTLAARLGEGALLASLADPVVCFEGARYRQRAVFDLACTADLVYLDVLSAGRVARGERWAFSSHRAELSVRREGNVLLRDATLLDPSQGPIAARMGRFDVLGTLVLVGPGLAEMRARIADEIASAPVAPGAPIVESASARDDALLVRFAAEAIEPALARVRAHLSELVPRVGDPFARKR
ncbi:MAG: urease accessory protein UreD [Deltaproteobacteria bacterium]|nr:urease accessory protein UreD [Deltaproteobacteria bacterium]